MVKTASDQFGEEIRIVDYEVPEGKEGFRSRWALITKNKDYFQNTQLIHSNKVVVQDGFKPWKDDYSSLISVIN